MEVTATWREGVSFAVATGSGHTIVTDGPTEVGGTGAGSRPMELLLASIATCSASDVVAILRKGKRSFAGVSVTVSGARAATIPAVFTHIALRFAVPGAEVAHAKRAVELSVEKYCSALRMIAAAAEIQWELTEDVS